MRLLKVIPFLTLVLSINLLMSNSASAQVNMIEGPANAKKSDNFLDNLSGFVTLSASTDFKETNDDTKAYGSQLSYIVNYVIDSDDSLRLDGNIEKGLSGEYRESVNDIRISHTKAGLYRSKNYILNYRTSLRIPTSERSVEAERMYTALELNLLNIFPLSNYIPGLTVIYIPRYRRFFNEFEFNENGETLVEQNLINILVMSYGVTDKITLSSTFVYINSLDYEGNRRPDSFGFTQDITYVLSKKFSASVGIQNGGAIRNFEQGTDSTVQIFDERSTSFYTGVNLVF